MWQPKKNVQVVSNVAPPLDNEANVTDQVTNADLDVQMDRPITPSSNLR